MLSLFFFFFFNDTATTEIYTLSLHDALPILLAAGMELGAAPLVGQRHRQQPALERHAGQHHAAGGLEVLARLLLGVGVAPLRQADQAKRGAGGVAGDAARMARALL